MAPQPKTKTQEQAKAESAQVQEDNANAVIGSAEDVIAEGETLPPKQDQEGDELESGVIDRKPIQRSPHDDVRSSIAARFRRAEPEDERPFNGDMQDPENIYGTVGAGDDEEGLTDDEVDARAAARESRTVKPPQPPKEEGEDDSTTSQRMITRIVRGKKTTMSEQEWLDRAAQVTAADSYLAEAREILKGAKELRGRSPPDRQHPDGGEGAVEDDLDREAPAEGEVQHPGPTFRDVVSKIQYGDPDDAAAELERLIDERASRKASEGQLQRAYDQDLARSQAALKVFADANKDLASDEYASMAIERGMYHLYKEDILALGITEEQLPRTTNELANWHRFYRMNGYEVRGTKELLETSKDRFVQWRGGSRSDSNQRSTTKRPAPSIQVNVQRDERRMAIPNQPTRAAVPRRDAQTPVRQSGSDVVAAMRRQRGQV